MGMVLETPTALRRMPSIGGQVRAATAGAAVAAIITPAQLTQKVQLANQNAYLAGAKIENESAQKKQTHGHGSANLF